MAQSRVMTIAGSVLLVGGVFLLLSHTKYGSQGFGISLRRLLQRPLSADAPELIEYARTVLWSPSIQPYNLSKPDQKFYYEDNGTVRVINALFGNKRAGRFIEAGAYDGEEISQTLYLEKSLGWTGLLVEANSELLEKMKYKHRKSYVYPGCVSPDPYPEQVEFMELSTLSHIRKMSDMMEKNTYYKCKKSPMIIALPGDKELTEMARTALGGCEEIYSNRTVQCLPLYTLLLATNLTNVDWFSLDVEGAEEAVLKSIPFHKVHIKVLRVEILLASRERIQKVMKATGIYRQLNKYKNESLVDEVTKGDMWFARKDFIVDEDFT